MAEWIKIQDPSTYCLQETHFRSKDTQRLKVKDEKGYFMQMETKKLEWGFPGGAVVGGLPASAGDTGSSPGLGGSRMPRSGWA